MKIIIFYASLVTGLLTTAALAAPAGGGAGTGSAAVVAPRTAIVPPTGVGGAPGGGTHPTGQVPRQPTLPDGTPQTTTQGAPQFSAATNFSPNANGLAGTNGNRIATNGLAGQANGSSSVSTTTVNPGVNSFVNSDTSINGNVVAGNQAVTASDRVLLTTLGQGVRSSLGIPANGNLPVHFMINNGTVTALGTVQSAAQGQSILSQVQQTPGVLSVVNGLHIARPADSAQSQSANSVFAGPTDHAFSARDQTLLTTVQQQAATQLGVNSVSQMPVHFSIQNGVVGVTGQLPSPQEKQALLTALARTPGIVRVVDNVGVINGAAGFGATATPNATMNRNLPATSRNQGGTNTIFLNSNNASGF